MTLDKIVLVIEPKYWIQMYPDSDEGIQQAKADRSMYRYPTRIERWLYPVLPDGTHGKPSKHRLSL